MRVFLSLFLIAACHSVPAEKFVKIQCGMSTAEFPISSLELKEQSIILHSDKAIIIVPAAQCIIVESSEK